MRPAHGVEVETSLRPELAVITNRELMEQALVNVADNAAKYTLAGRITIEGRAADEGAEIVVTDTGPGIPSEQQTRVLDRFYRAGSSSEGFGLGFAIVRSARCVGRPTRARVEGRRGNNGSDARSTSGQPRRSMSRVLVVDDESAIRDSVAYALRSDGFEVEEAADGETGLERALSREHDVVILDLMLPGMPGTEVCRRIRAESAVPIIMLTARDAELDQVLGLEIGADDYVTKPFSMAELMGESGDPPTARARSIGLDRAAGGPARARRDETRPVSTVSRSGSRPRSSSFCCCWPSSRNACTAGGRSCSTFGTASTSVTSAPDIHISNLRQKLERDPAHPERILTIEALATSSPPCEEISTHFGGTLRGTGLR